MVKFSLCAKKAIAARTPLNVVPTSNAMTRDRTDPVYGFRVSADDFMVVQLDEIVVDSRVHEERSRRESYSDERESSEVS